MTRGYPLLGRERMVLVVQFQPAAFWTLKDINGKSFQVRCNAFREDREERIDEAVASLHEVNLPKDGNRDSTIPALLALGLAHATARRGLGLL